jgi:DNA-binding sugar fermentation-stimulating protein
MKLDLFEFKIINKKFIEIRDNLVLIQNNKYEFSDNDVVRVSLVKNNIIEMVKMDNIWIGINPNNAKKLFMECIDKKILEDFKYYQIEKTQVKILNYILDFSLHNNYERIYVKIINISLIENNAAIFDEDLSEIYNLKNEGYNIGLIFIVQREDVEILHCKNIKKTFDFIYCYKFKCFKNSIKFLEKLTIKIYK